MPLMAASMVGISALPSAWLLALRPLRSVSLAR
jgi:hypothetical protein